MAFLIIVVDLAVRILSLVVIVHVFLGYFMSPFHPIRETLNRIIEPMLAPIRRIVPPLGMLDLKPFDLAGPDPNCRSNLDLDLKIADVSSCIYRVMR